MIGSTKDNEIGTKHGEIGEDSMEHNAYIFVTGDLAPVYRLLSEGAIGHGQLMLEKNQKPGVSHS